MKICNVRYYVFLLVYFDIIKANFVCRRVLLYQEGPEPST